MAKFKHPAGYTAMEAKVTAIEVARRNGQIEFFEASRQIIALRQAYG